ncbi:uncharacterized protein C12orf56 isoform X2 [Cryptotermes secundus]|uniref:uncharacterized protein C12orf56 isoform X2 n=1 Tax=Cryptotermes secundus TaxID=105785 RepID=UPI001454DBE9|nr:uncharacterized protein C12orf56 isoform X2 [Cryptotermes secundus]
MQRCRAAQCAAGCLRAHMARRISRLESFLKRALPGPVFDGIRYYEGCVVRVGKDGLSFKYVVITGRSLLLADHPPRDVHEVVRLADVTSITVEHDFPDFLKGPQRDTCQHIRMEHRKHGLRDSREETSDSQMLVPTEAGSPDDRPISATPTPLGRPEAPAPEPGAENAQARNSPDIGALLRRVETQRPHIPRSRSSLAQYPQAQVATSRAHSSLDKPRPRRVRDVDAVRGTQKPDSVQEADFHLYVLQAGSALLDHLQSGWRARILMLQFNRGAVLKRLLTLLVTPPSIPNRHRTVCCHMLEDFREFGSGGWTNLPEAELIKMLAEVTNVSTAILYELLLTLQNMIQNKSALKLTKLLDGVAMECHMKRSVSQLLGLLFPSPAHKLTPLEAVLVYQHVFVLKCLMESLSRVQDYVQEQFEEEFRYYVRWSRVSRKLPDSYPIKRLLQQLVDGVQQLASRGHTNLIPHNSADDLQ